MRGRSDGGREIKERGEKETDRRPERREMTRDDRKRGREREWVVMKGEEVNSG